MVRILGLDRWRRRHHFEFFKDYEQPFFNICAEVDVSQLYEATTDRDTPSFFLASLYLSLKSANEIEPFGYRLRDGSVVVYEVVHAGSTILRDDGTFGFAYFDYLPDYSRFETNGLAVLERSRAQTGRLEDRPERADLIHYSVLPWIGFSSFSHARRLPAADSTPKVVFGKHSARRDGRMMPVSVEVHHALMDGREVGLFFETFQSHLDDLSPLGL